MQIRPFEELEAMARARYQARYASVPEPTVINVDALVQFHAPRTFEWGGVGLRAPPLSFVNGVRLLVAANALRDLRQAKAPPPFLQAAVQTAALLLRQSVTPLKTRKRLGWRFSRCFRDDDPEMIEGFLRWLLHVPDDAPSIPPNGKVTWNLVGSVMQFAGKRPALVFTDRWRFPWNRKKEPVGFPVSWAAYIHGMREINRENAQDILRSAMAVRAGGAEQKDYKSFNAELSEAAGWYRG